MGQSTDALLAFGICFGEDPDFPWDDDLEEWWRERNGFETDKGEREDWAAYRVRVAEFDAAYPLPVEVVTHCHHESPMYILAVAGTVTRASRGYPQPVATPAVDTTAFLQWMHAHHITHPDPPHWLLFSDWS